MIVSQVAITFHSSGLPNVVSAAELSTCLSTCLGYVEGKHHAHSYDELFITTCCFPKTHQPTADFLHALYQTFVRPPV